MGNGCKWLGMRGLVRGAQDAHFIFEFIFEFIAESWVLGLEGLWVHGGLL